VFLSPLAALCVPLVLERMLSTTPAYWTTDFHYSLTIAPVLAMGAADGLANLVRLLRIERVAQVVCWVAVCGMLGVSFHLARDFPLDGATRASFWRDPVEARNARVALSRIPDDASVAAQDVLVPHLSRRQEIYDIRPETPPTDYVVFNEEGRWGTPYPNPSFAALRDIVAAHTRGYERVFERAGWVVLERRP
jgi:uncharacterized membrane protein